MILSFTGTQRGLDPSQLEAVAGVLASGVELLVHGGCIGADDEADQLAAELGIDRLVFPSTRLDKRVADEVLRDRKGSRVTIREAMEPLKRNRLIVKYGQKLVACPYEREEVVRSGTWATVRYAQRIGRGVVILKRRRH